MTTIVARVRALSPLTRGVALFAVANTAAANLLAAALPSRPPHEVALRTTASFLRFRAGADSWLPMSQAWGYLRTPAHVSVYDHIYHDLGNKFQYPLTSLLPIEAMQALLGSDAVRFGPLNLVSWLSVWGTAAFVALVFDAACRRYIHDGGAGRSPRLDRLARAGIAIALTITFYPVVKAFTIGQVQTTLDLLFAMVVWLWLTGRRGEAGAVTGLMCVVKPQLGLLLVWAALRRQWGFAAGLAAVVASAAAAALALYGVEQNRDFIAFSAFVGRHGESYWPNQSVNGLLHHVLMNGDSTVFRIDGATTFAPYHPAVYAGTAVSSVLLVGLMLFWRRAEFHAGGEFDLLIAGLTATIASPIAWQHHYGVLMPIYAVLLPAMLRWPVLGGATLVWLGASYVLTSNVFSATTYAAGTPFTPVQSYLLAGALIALAALYRLRHAAAAETQRAGPTGHARRGGGVLGPGP